MAELRKRGAISRYAVPDRVYFVDAIPKTSVGKLDKKVIRAKLPSARRGGRPLTTVDSDDGTPSS